MFGNFSAQLGVLGGAISNSPNIINPQISWLLNSGSSLPYFVLDFTPFGNQNFSDRPRINVWRGINGDPDFNNIQYFKVGYDVLSPAPIGRFINIWGNRNSGSVSGVGTAIYNNINYQFQQSLTGKLISNFYFGESASINKDGDIILIGATNIIRTGEAMVFTFSDNTWRLKQTFTGDKSATYFGENTLISNSGNVIGISATRDNPNNLNFAGSIDIFTGNKNLGWKFRQKISGDLLNGEFGYSTAVNENGDILIVGSPFSSPGGLFQAGCVTIFTGNENLGWSFRQRISGRNNGRFGYSVAANNNSDVIVIGGPVNYVGGNPRGAIDIYVGNPFNGWTFKQSFTGELNSDEFGSSVSINENGNIIAVGAPQEPNDSTKSGIVYLFTGNSSLGWNLKQKIIGLNSQSRFGFESSLNKNGNRLLIGTNLHHVNIFTGDINSTWSFNKQVSGNPGSFLGANGMDINKDGNIFVVGAVYDSPNSITHAGTASIFENKGNEIIAGVDVFAHEATPLNLNKLLPPFNSGWEIIPSVVGELHYQYKYRVGETKPVFNIVFDDENIQYNFVETAFFKKYNGGFWNNWLYSHLGYISDNSNPSDKGFVYGLEGKSLFFEVAEKYPYFSGLASTNPWFFGINQSTGVANIGVWKFTSGLNTFRGIKNSTGNGRPSLGNCTFPVPGSFFDPNGNLVYFRDAAFFINGSRTALGSHTVTLSYPSGFYTGVSVSADVSYSWNKGERSVFFLTGQNINQFLYKIEHKDNDALTFYRSQFKNNSPVVAQITNNAFNKAYTYKVSHVGNGILFEAKEYNGNTIFSNLLPGIPPVVNSDGKILSSSELNIITGIGFLASLDNVSTQTWDNYGLFFNNLTYDWPPKYQELNLENKNNLTLYTTCKYDIFVKTESTNPPICDIISGAPYIEALVGKWEASLPPGSPPVPEGSYSVKLLIKMPIDINNQPFAIKFTENGDDFYKKTPDIIWKGTIVRPVTTLIVNEFPPLRSVPTLGSESFIIDLPQMFDNTVCAEGGGVAIYAPTNVQSGPAQIIDCPECNDGEIKLRFTNVGTVTLRAVASNISTFSFQVRDNPYKLQQEISISSANNPPFSQVWNLGGGFGPGAKLDPLVAEGVGSVGNEYFEFDPALTLTNISLNGSGDILVVGQPYEPNSSSNRGGKVSIYYKTGTNWILRSTLLPPSLGQFSNSNTFIKNYWFTPGLLNQYVEGNIATGINFGYDVATNNDGSVIIVGAPSYLVGAAGIGGVQSAFSTFSYIYTGSKNNGWQLHQILSSEDTENYGFDNFNNFPAEFGASVAISKENDDIFIGAPNVISALDDFVDEGNLGDPFYWAHGALSVYRKNSSTWTINNVFKKSTESNTLASQKFGRSIALSSGSALISQSRILGYITIAPGLAAPDSSPLTTKYVFSELVKDNFNWKSFGTPKNPCYRCFSIVTDVSPYDDWGYSVDINRNGTKYIVGAPYAYPLIEDPTTSNRKVGTARVYDVCGTPYYYPFQDLFNNTSQTDSFGLYGWSVACDYNSGFLMGVGGPKSSINGTRAGAVKLFGPVFRGDVFYERDCFYYNHIQNLVPPGLPQNNTNLNFGQSISISNDGNTVAVAAKNKVFIYTGNLNNILT
jgi:hypothetical protein